VQRISVFLKILRSLRSVKQFPKLKLMLKKLDYKAHLRTTRCERDALLPRDALCDNKNLPQRHVTSLMNKEGRERGGLLSRCADIMGLNGFAVIYRLGERSLPSPCDASHALRSKLKSHDSAKMIFEIPTEVL